MVSRKFRSGLRDRFGFDQWTDTDKDAEDIAVSWFFRKVSSGGLQQKLDFLFGCARFENGLGNRRVGRSDQSMVIPWDQKDHSSVAGFRDDHRRITGKETLL